MISLTTPEDVLAAVSFMVGFEPSDSMVIVGLKDDDVQITMRIDYPEQTVFENFERVCTGLLSHDVDNVILVSYIPDETDNTESVLDLHVALTHYKIKTTDSIVVYKNKYKSILCEDKSCCPEDGKPMPDLKNTRFTAEMVLEGEVMPFNSREEFDKSLSRYVEEPEIVAVLNTLPEVDDDEGCRIGADLVDKLLEEFSTNGRSINKREVAQLIMATKHVTVRDYMLGIVNDDNIEDVQNFWRWLLSVTPAAYRPPLLTLNAAIAYERGDGASANTLTELALAQDPDYTLAQLLRRVFNAGWPAESFKAMREELHPKVIKQLAR